MEDMVGKRFGRLTVISYEGKRYDGHHTWKCLCSCGKESVLSRNSLTNKKAPTRSCGCLQLESARKVNRKHGMCSTPIYKVWTAMKQRCLNKNTPEYSNYGGRGIKVCQTWMKFENFLADMGHPKELGLGKLSIERKDNNKGYSKQNCKWATIEEQLLNRRNTVKVTLNRVTKPLKTWCRERGVNYCAALARLHAGKDADKVLERTEPHTMFLVFQGTTKRMGEWADEFGLKISTLSYRLHSGWSVEDALTTPVSNTRHK